MMDKLLQGVLQGEFPVGSALQWMHGDDSVSPPTHLLPQKSQSAWQQEALTPEGFKAFILNYVRDQAEFILSAAEKKGRTSRGGTPQPSGPNTFGSGAPVTRSKRTDAEHLRQLESVARRLDPGAVDEANFPSLGGSTKATSNASQQQKPSLPAAVAIIPKQMKRIVATPVAVTGGGDGNLGAAMNSGNTPRRRIQPTQVAEVEVSKKFVTAQLVEPALSPPNFSSTVSGTSKLASRLGAIGLDDDTEESSNPFQNSNTTTAAATASVAAHSRNQVLYDKEVTPQKVGSNLVSKNTIEFSTPLTNKLTFEGEASIPNSSSTSAAAAAAAAAVAPAPPSPFLSTAAGSVAPPPAPSAPRILALSASGHALAALHAGILRLDSNISLTTEVNLLLNLLAVPLAAEVDSSLVACPELGILLTCGVQSQQYAALVLQHAGGLLKGLGLQLLEEIAAAAAATATALDNLTLDTITPTSFQLLEKKNGNSNNKTSLPTPMEVMNMFKQTASTAEFELRSKQLRTEKPFNRIPATGSRNSIAGGVGLHAFTADGVRSRSVEDQRRVSNREACRDAFFALMRDAASRAAFFGRNQKIGGGGGGAGGGGFQNNTTTGAPVSVSLSLVSGADGRSHSGEPDGVVFGRIQVAASNLLRTLRPDNFSVFAELLTAAILQAAATGDALMDEELAKLAKRDGVSRFHSLNRRMQGAEPGGAGGGGSGGAGGGGGNSGVGPRRGNPMALSRLNSSGSTSIGFGNSTNNTALSGGVMLPLEGIRKNPTSPFKQQNSASNAGNKTQRPGSANTTTYGPQQSSKKNLSGSYNNNSTTNYTNSQLPAGAQAAMDEAAACAAGIMSEFPRALSLYILFLEAADSHRLNAALTRVMTEKLKLLAKPHAVSAAAAGQSLGEKVVAASALAGILGYLAFSKNNASAKPASWDSDKEESKMKYDGSHPIDVAGALHASLGTSHVLRTVPWVTRYLNFLKWDSEAVQAPYFKSVLSMLGNLKCAPELSPGGAGFGPAALCLRSLLDDFSATVLPLPTPSTSTGTIKNNSTILGVSADSAFGTALSSSDQSIDLRFLDLCCPVLAHARRSFASEGGVVLRSEPRRILPTAPLVTAAAVAPPLPSASDKPSVIRPSSSSPFSDIAGENNNRGGVQRQQGVGQEEGFALVKKKSTLSTSNISGTATTAHVGGLDPVKLRLQQTFLQQYSQEDKLVKLKDVVEYCSDVIGCNAATATVAKLAPDAIKAASDELVTLVTEYAETSAFSNLSSTSTNLSIEEQQVELERFSNAAAEKATSATIKKVLHAAFEAAQEPIKVASTRAVLGLVSSELGDAVIATAAAMVAETASEACASRLPALVQKAIRQDDLAGHAKSAVKLIVKERKKLQSTHDNPIDSAALASDS